MAEIVQIDTFLSLAATYPVVDVRAPAEYTQGHIPGAVNIPLFSDDERREVGTAYKQVNREAAMYIGLDHAGKKLVDLAKDGERTAGRKKTLLVHCWRGGMRSKSMVWLFETMGIHCYLLEGGYKSYRRYVREVLASELDLVVIGGMTGSGKTEILGHLLQRGEQVINLEALAHHKGSAFGALGEGPQPTTEQFENEVCQKLKEIDLQRRVWIEDESRNIGRCVVPNELYRQMKQGRLLFLEIPRELRSEKLVDHYAGFGGQALKEGILKIERKLGGDCSREAMEAVDRGDFYHAAMITLHYYDKSYLFSLKKNHERFDTLSSDSIDPAENAELLMKFLHERKS